MDITRGQWVVEFFRRCGYRNTTNNFAGVLTWIRAEWGGSAPIPARYNPLSIVTKRTGSTDFNSTGVQNFLTVDDGLDATVQTLLTGDYPDIRLQLSRGDDDQSLIVAIAASHWGSKPNGSFLAYTQQHLTAESELAIAPAQSPPVPSVLETDMILCPNKLPINGRQPFAVLDIVNKRVLLFNGASLAAGSLVDSALGSYRIWPVPTTSTVIGMDATRDPITHAYDNRGVVVSSIDGGTFEAHWR